MPGGRFGSAVAYAAIVNNSPHYALLVGAPEDGDGKVYAYDSDTGLQLGVIASNRVASQFGTSLTSGFIAFAGAPRYDLAGYAIGGVTAIGTGERLSGYSQRVGVGSRDLDLAVATNFVAGGLRISVAVSGARPNSPVYLALSRNSDIFGLHVPSLNTLASWYLDPTGMDGMFVGTTDGQGNLTAVLPRAVADTLRGFTYNFQALVGSEFTPARKLIL